MPIQIPGDPFGGGVAANGTQGLKLVDKKPAKYDRYALLQGALQKDAGLVMKKTREMELAQAKEAINNLEQIRQERENDPDHGWKLTQGKNALERESGMSLREEVETGFQQDVAEAMKGVKSQWGRKLVGEYVEKATAAQRQAINRHVLQQEGVYQDAVDNQTLSTAQQMIMADDPKTVAQGIQLAETTCQSVESRKGVPVDRTKFIGPLHTQVVSRMITAGRLSEARAYVKNNRKQIGAQDLQRINAAIEKRKESAAIESMVARDGKIAHPDADGRSTNEVILDIRSMNPDATAEQVQTAAALVIGKRMQVQAAAQREHEAEIGYAYEHIRAGGSLTAFPYFEHLTPEEQKAAQAYENKVRTNSLVTDSRLFYQLSNDDTLARLSWGDLYRQRQYFADDDFDFLVARKQTLANEGKSKAIPQTFNTAGKLPNPSAIKVDAAVKDALIQNNYVARNKVEEKLYGRTLIVLNRIIGDEVRRNGIPAEKVPEYARKRTDQILKERLVFSGVNWKWLPRSMGGDYDGRVADFASGDESLHLSDDLQKIIDAGIQANGIGMPDDNSRWEQLFTISFLPHDPIPGASEMAQVIRALDPDGFNELVQDSITENGAAPTASYVVRAYLANKFVRTQAVAQEQEKQSKKLAEQKEDK
nr:MAG TPA: hypothetical protein [Bacteriophage sp.]